MTHDLHSLATVRLPQRAHFDVRTTGRWQHERRLASRISRSWWHWPAVALALLVAAASGAGVVWLVAMMGGGR